MLNIKKNREAKKYTKVELILRVTWIIGSCIFSYTPRNFFKARVWLLKLFGAEIGENFHIYPSAVVTFPWNLKVGNNVGVGERVMIYNLGKLTLENNVTISQDAYLCGGTHDYHSPELTLIKKEIKVEENAWICARAFVHPGIIISEGSVVGACSVVTKNTKPYDVVAGHPAKALKKRIINTN